MKQFLIFSLFVSIAIMAGCAPMVKNMSIVQLPSQKIRSVTVDLSRVEALKIENTLKTEDRAFSQAVPEAFAKYGVTAAVSGSAGIVMLPPPSPDAFILFISLVHTITGSGISSVRVIKGDGQGEEYRLDLYQRSSRQLIWSSSVFLPRLKLFGAASGEIIAKSIVSMMNDAKLFSDEVVSDQVQPVVSTTQSSAKLSNEVQQAFTQFKSIQASPKAFAIGNNGTASVTEIGQSLGQDAPSQRALKSCQAQYSNCRILSDGVSVF